MQGSVSFENQPGETSDVIDPFGNGFSQTVSASLDDNQQNLSSRQESILKDADFDSAFDQLRKTIEENKRKRAAQQAQFEFLNKPRPTREVKLEKAPSDGIITLPTPLAPVGTDEVMHPAGDFGVTAPAPVESAPPVPSQVEIVEQENITKRNEHLRRIQQNRLNLEQQVAHSSVTAQQEKPSTTEIDFVLPDDTDIPKTAITQAQPTTQKAPDVANNYNTKKQPDTVPLELIPMPTIETPRGLERGERVMRGIFTYGANRLAGVKKAVKTWFGGTKKKNTVTQVKQSEPLKKDDNVSKPSKAVDNKINKDVAVPQVPKVVEELPRAYLIAEEAYQREKTRREKLAASAPKTSKQILQTSPDDDLDDDLNDESKTTDLWNEIDGKTTKVTTAPKAVGELPRAYLIAEEAYQREKARQERLLEEKLERVRVRMRQKAEEERAALIEKIGPKGLKLLDMLTASKKYLPTFDATTRKYIGASVATGGAIALVVAMSTGQLGNNLSKYLFPNSVKPMVVVVEQPRTATPQVQAAQIEVQSSAAQTQTIETAPETNLTPEMLHPTLKPGENLWSVLRDTMTTINYEDFNNLSDNDKEKKILKALGKIATDAKARGIKSGNINVVQAGQVIDLTNIYN